MKTTEAFSGVIRPHVSLDVTELARSVSFYSALFGMEPTKVRDGYAKFEVPNPSLNFSMNERPERAGIRGSLSHLGIQVATTEDVERAKNRLQQAGLASFDEKDVTCCYAKQDKIWVTDPDGNPWEVFAVTEANTEKHSTGAANEASGAAEAKCCEPRRTYDESGLLVLEEACC